jgi:hypothetical protein
VAEYNPLAHSIVQAVTGELYCKYEATDFHIALLFAIAREIGRVHWNRFQTSWNRWSDDPHIPGIQWTQYQGGCDCPEDGDGCIPQHSEECRATKANFVFEDIEFRWYKNPGRGTSVSKDMPAEQWLAWFERCLSKIREFDSGAWATEVPLPKVAHFHLGKCDFAFDIGGQYHPDVRPILEQLSTAAERADADLSGEKWPRIVPRDPASRKAIVLAIALGVFAEKQRAIHEGRPRA